MWGVQRSLFGETGRLPSCVSSRSRRSCRTFAEGESVRLSTLLTMTIVVFWLAEPRRATTSGAMLSSFSSGIGANCLRTFFNCGRRIGFELRFSLVHFSMSCQALSFHLQKVVHARIEAVFYITFFRKSCQRHDRCLISYLPNQTSAL